MFPLNFRNSRALFEIFIIFRAKECKAFFLLRKLAYEKSDSDRIQMKFVELRS